MWFPHQQIHPQVAINALCREKNITSAQLYLPLPPPPPAPPPHLPLAPLMSKAEK